MSPSAVPAIRPAPPTPSSTAPAVFDAPQDEAFAPDCPPAAAPPPAGEPPGFAFPSSGGAGGRAFGSGSSESLTASDPPSLIITRVLAIRYPGAEASTR